MFNYFHRTRKWGNEKGQLTPLFLVVIVVFIIMSLVTVNLSKVALYKTNSANAADAGSLACGSVMANVFNSIAVANSELEAAYWTFFVTISISYVLMNLELVRIMLKVNLATTTTSTTEAQACPMPCTAQTTNSTALTAVGAAIGMLEKFLLGILALIASITWFWIGQHEYIEMIQETAVEGRLSAIKLGHKFAFMNSGVGGRLKSGSAADLVGDEDANNYQNSYSSFLDGIESAGAYNYSWNDGSGRDHRVATSVATEDTVDWYDAQVTLMPYSVEMATLLAILVMGYLVRVTLVTAEIMLTLAGIILGVACGFWSCRNAGWPLGAICTALWGIFCAIAEIILGATISLLAPVMGQLTAMMVMLELSWAGLAPARTSDTEAWNWADEIPCWLNEVNHNRLVDVSVSLKNQGQDLGLWNTRYPTNNPDQEIISTSQVNFSGLGVIHDPDPRFDPSIVDTDDISPVPVS